MARFHCRLGKMCQNFVRYLRTEYEALTILYYSLVFNSFTSWHTILDASLEPVFWFVDTFARYLGPIFVFLVITLTSTVVGIFYIYILPYVYSLSIGWTIFHLFFGHWLLVNIVFHYFKGVTVKPGYPPEVVPNVVSICKKCISPKPPRTHHCSVCTLCILKMDHHCPWLNNCVGHFNHRYFFLFMVYMCSGTIYVCISDLDLFLEEFFYSGTAWERNPLLPDEVEKSLYEMHGGDSLPGGFMCNTNGLCIEDGHLFFRDHVYSPVCWVNESLPHPVDISNTVEKWYHFGVIFEFFLCSGVTVALGLLMLWHARLISRGETSIEMHINNKERTRLKKQGLVFQNPYNFGYLNNWKRFLGFSDLRSFILNVLLPSSHKPIGNGIQWDNSLYEVKHINKLQVL